MRRALEERRGPALARVFWWTSSFSESSARGREGRRGSVGAVDVVKGSSYGLLSVVVFGDVSW